MFQHAGLNMMQISSRFMTPEMQHLKEPFHFLKSDKDALCKTSEQRHDDNRRDTTQQKQTLQ